MPATSTPRDRFDYATGLTYRTCRECGIERTLTAENFYQRVDNDGTIRPHERRCQACRRVRDAANRAARRAGRSTRGGRKFGIEIEYIGESRTVANEMERRGVRCRVEGYNHRVGTGWKIVSDASVHGGYELVSPPLSGAAGIAQLKVACDALDAAGARVNRSCGLHVHHDVSDLDAGQFGRLFRGWANNQPNVDQLVAPSRRRSQWAMPLNESNVREIERAITVSAIRSHAVYQNRYQALNVNCFPRYGTVEVRQHQGTLNFDKIAGWLAFGQAMIALAKSAAPIDAAPTTADLLDRLGAHGLTAEQVDYLKGRAAHFAGRRSVAA